MISLFPCDESCTSSRLTQISSLREELPHFPPGEVLDSSTVLQLQCQPRKTSHPAKTCILRGDAAGEGLKKKSGT